MKLYCNECYKEIEDGSVLVVQALALAEGDDDAVMETVAPQKFCMHCAAELFIILQERFNGKVDEKLLSLIQDFKSFLHDEDHSGIENIITYLREGVNLYFGYDTTERNFLEGELLQFRLLAAEEAHAILKETHGLIEHNANHVFVTQKGAAFTVQEGNTHFKQN
jgi:hypothetical protein